MKIAPHAPLTLTRDTLVDALQPALGGSKTQLRAVLDAAFAEMADALRRGDTVHIRGFGRFFVDEASERPGRNPKTGEPFTIAARRRIKFKPSQQLREGAGA